jgi:hypothetical protein
MSASTGISHPKQIGNQQASALRANASITALIVHSVDSDGNYVSPGAGSTQISIKEILSSSGGSLIDSSNVSLGVTIRAGSAAGTEYTDGDIDATISGQAILFDNSSNTLRPVTITRGFPVNIVAGSASSTETTVRQSTYTDFNTLSRIGDRDSTAQVAAVLGSAPASTTFALVVREAAPSTGPFQISSVGGVVAVSTGPVQISSVGGVVAVSTGPSLSRLVDRDQATQTAAVLGSAPVSTTYGLVTRDLSTGPYVISSVGGVVTVSTGPFQISSVGGVVTVSTGPFVISSVGGIVTANLGTNLQSTVAPSSGSSGLVVRPVIDAIQSTGSTAFFGGGGNSTIFTLQSSAAAIRAYVTAYSFTSTNQTPFTIGFYSSANLMAPIKLAAISSAVTGVNLAVSAPAYLFRTEAAAALSLRIDQSSRTGDVGWVSWYLAP